MDRPRVRTPRGTRQCGPLLIVGVVLTGLLAPLIPASARVGFEAVTPQAVARVPFTADSFWNTRHDDRKAYPTDTNSANFMADLKAAVPANRRYVELAGTDNDAWGYPYYWPNGGTAKVTVTCELAAKDECYGFDIPPTGKPKYSLRLPADAEPSNSVDSEMVVVDTTTGTQEVVWFWQACPPAPFRNTYCKAKHDHWTANGMSVHSLTSDGLDGCWETNFPGLYPNGEAANRGHRGLPGVLVAIQYNEAAVLDSIPHMLKVSIPNTGDSHFFPYSGDEERHISDAIPEGIVMRIKPTIDLSKYGLTSTALVIARALQQFGAVVGDTSGLGANIAVENLYVSGSSARWSKAGIAADSLSDVPLDDYEFISRGAGGPAPTASPCGRNPK
jgi:hypothetical protein